MSDKTARIQELIFSIICDIDDYCSENDIRYYLSGGTCLGAVRHHGFIPWDDDGDIMMPRPDYERFMKGFKKKYSDKYGVGSLRTDKEWHIQFGRVWDRTTKAYNTYQNIKEIGVFVDIFPIDGLPDQKWKQSLTYKKIKFFDILRDSSLRLSFKKGEKIVAIKKILRMICRPIGPNYFARMVEKQVRRYDFDKSKYVAACMICHYGAAETIEHEKMAGSVRMLFEGRLLPVPVGYDTYLSNLYGDYMKIPKDTTTHSDWEIEI